MRLRTVLLVGAATALTTACTTVVEGVPGPSANIHQTGSKPEPTAPRVLSLLPKQWGEQAGIRNDALGLMVSFSFDKIVVDPKCTGRAATKPANGHFIAITVTAETGPNYDGATLHDLNSADFKVIDPSGDLDTSPLQTAAANRCLPGSRYLPDLVKQGQVYRGEIVLDTRFPKGSVVFRPGTLQDNAGWSWAF
ncbi:hypothetical protein [Actinokineospora pegani]|uniref:hypothetical protein n=1 Tax=Actinokineospora pegani TaxID=2654637 RepID=UPI0012EA8306|nr:hypothetical protein [Actinokineospora pegani]